MKDLIAEWCQQQRLWRILLFATASAATVLVVLLRWLFKNQGARWERLSPSRVSALALEVIGLAILVSAFAVLLYLYKLTPNHPILWGVDLIILPATCAGIILVVTVGIMTLVVRQRR